MGLLNFVMSHEMYHRGQFTVCQCLLGIEPALTERFRQMLSQSAKQNA
ncbi:MAG: DinB family protein [Acidobacteriota bacterium]